MFDLSKLKRILDLANIKYRKIGNYIFIDVNRKATIDINLKKNQIAVSEYILEFHSLAKPFRKNEFSLCFEDDFEFLTKKEGLVSLWQNRRYRFKTIQEILKVICQHL